MCIIIDASVFHEGRSGRTEAGGKLFEWILDGKSKMAIGGKLLQEIAGNSRAAAEWIEQAKLAKHIMSVDDNEVNDEAKRVDQEGICESNDSHVIALARVSGARLLYSIDTDLHTDFGNPKLLNKPRGKVYSTLKEWDRNFTDKHRELLATSHCAGS